MTVRDGPESAVGSAHQGISVTLSADSNTAIVGGYLDNSGIGAAWVFVQPTVPFSAFSAKLAISSYQPRFTLSGDFVLGRTSNGINPLFEAVTLQIGSFTITIPPGSFQMTKPGDYSFIGVIDSVTANVQIDLMSGSKYTFQAVVDASLIRTKSPATVTLTIGNDTGTMSVRF